MVPLRRFLRLVEWFGSVHGEAAGGFGVDTIPGVGYEGRRFARRPSAAAWPREPRGSLAAVALLARRHATHIWRDVRDLHARKSQTPPRLGAFAGGRANAAQRSASVHRETRYSARLELRKENRAALARPMWQLVRCTPTQGRDWNAAKVESKTWRFSKRSELPPPADAIPRSPPCKAPS